MTVDPLLTQMLADAEAQASAIPDDDKLCTIGTLAAELVDLNAQVAAAEKALEELIGKRDKLAEVTLPEALALTGLVEFKLEDGSKVTVGDEYYPNIPSAESDNPEALTRRANCFRWMRDNGHADLIKNEVKLTFSKGEDDKAKRVTNGLDKAGIPYRQLESVHHSTLKAFVAEQIENNKPFPRETFGVHHKRVAKVKPASKRRK
jgi:hypothetical protein